MAATLSRLFNCFSASKVALITLCGLVVPIDFVSTFCTPTEVITARTAPPAITPVPSGAGFSSTRPEPNVPSTACGIEVLLRLTRIRFFLADSIPLRIACGTSLALPEPYPTTPADGSPTTTRAANERFLPPLTTLVTRLMATTWSFSWYAPASSFLITIGIVSLALGLKLRASSHKQNQLAGSSTHSSQLKLQSRFASCVGQCLHPPVIYVSTAIEHHLGD